ncbi:uncharacterized protein B0T15DRAFT_79577 [Chaetomium strumarium]|uniref:Uncharacterized protein n=1 Tax=Chaetomium strumarium TaxID=1170767 RepID=A0AAJ0H4B7_9PEZI|nr:hypothetical protein B0T15DRAFT_79577 [Chaetomium strumarium]
MADVYTWLSAIDPSTDPTAFGRDSDGHCHEPNNLYSLYNWELGFHAPMLLADRLLKSQKYDEALQVCRFVFNPLGTGVETGSQDRRPAVQRSGPRRTSTASSGSYRSLSRRSTR